MSPHEEPPQPIDIAEFVAPGWERHRDFLFDSGRPASEWLVEQIDPQPGQTLLELAAGPDETGFLAAERVGREGKLISADFSPRMVEAARRGAEAGGLGNSSAGSWTRSRSSCRTPASTRCSPGSA
jgi:ubiquinone/menaquinone biosynthesis C-methylase UbiE